MRAGAAASFKRVQEVLASRPEDPCAVLLGEKLARTRVRRLLGTSLGFAPDLRATPAPCDPGPGVRAEAFAGLVLVEPPEELGSAELTELATFLKGLHQAHGLLIARSAAGDDASAGGQTLAAQDDSGEEAAPLIASFYGQQDAWQALVVVAVIDAASEDDASDAAREAICRHGLEVPGAPLPKVFRIDIGSEAQRLATWLSGQEALPCEPLQVNSPLLSSYRVIRQQLARRRPTSKASQRPAADARPASAPSTPEVKQPEQAPDSPDSKQAKADDEDSPPASPGTAALALEDDFGRPAVEGQPFGHWTVMVFGKTGAGKSHLANLMVGHDAFISGDSLASVTNTESVRRAVSIDGTITLLDTIGFGDTRLPPETVISSLRDTALEAPHGIDVLLFVMKKERVTPVEQEILAYVTQLLFGPACLPNLYMVVTRAGRLAKDVQHRGPWLKEQMQASPVFAAMVAFLGPEPLRKIAFVENSDVADAEDEDERVLVERRRHRAFADVRNMLELHRCPPYRHGIMRQAGEFQRMHMDEMRRDLQNRIEDEVRKELDKEKGDLEAERMRMQSDVEAQKQELQGDLEAERTRLQHDVEAQKLELQAREEEMQRRFESEWGKMKDEFASRARDMARQDLEPLAQEIVETTEEKAKAKGRWCVVQ